MSPTTHHLTATATALVGAWALRTPDASQYLALLAQWTPRSLPFVAGALLGARAPDWMELAAFSVWLRRRISVIPHRTITHWPWPWLLGLAVTVYLLPNFNEYPARELTYAALGFLTTGILHLALDILTPTGIPIGINPFGTRTALAHVRTGSPVEILVSLSAWVIALGLVDVIKRTT